MPLSATQKPANEPETITATETIDGILATLTEAFRGKNSSVAEKRGRGRPKSNHWRLDFVADNPTTVRARLRRGSGKNRNNVYDERGNISVRNYLPLGTIEDVYHDPTYKQWQKRCEGFCATTGYKLKSSGAGNRHADRPAKTGVAGIALDEWGSLEVYQPQRTD